MAMIFGMGGGEIALICVIALIVLGPKKLPEVALSVGRVFGELKKATNEFQREFMRAQNEFQQFKDETIGEATKPFRDIMRPGMDGNIEGQPQPRIEAPEGERVAAPKPQRPGPAFQSPPKAEKTEADAKEKPPETESVS